jgi:RHS repeat-associated protein
VLARRAYTYRADGCLAIVDDLLAGSRRFTLDDQSRITAVTGDRWAERYRYDPAGNLASARWSAPPPGAASTWLAADLQGPRDRTGTLVTRAGAVRYRHDRQGRVIQRQRARSAGKPATWSYQWDADDRLTAVTTPDGSTWRYRYDPLGRRIAKQRLDPAGLPAEETTFTWDGAVLAEETTFTRDRAVPAEETRFTRDRAVPAEQSAGAGETGLRRRRTWDYRPGTFTPLIQSETVSPADAPQQVIDERFYAIIADQVGMPAELVGADGTLAGHQQHTVWGGTLWRPGGAATPLRFPGQYHDPETGLHYNQQRYYDPVTGSYLTPDPLGLAPAPNPHTYVPNPLIQADPLGLMSCRPSGHGTVDPGALGDGNTSRGPRFIARSGGEVVRIPDGAVGPFPARTGNGFLFTDGSGGGPLDSRVVGIRVMDPVTSGKHHYPHGYVSYFNKDGQPVSPFTGRTLTQSDPLWHWAWRS